MKHTVFCANAGLGKGHALKNTAILWKTTFLYIRTYINELFVESVTVRTVQSVHISRWFKRLPNHSHSFGQIAKRWTIIFESTGRL